MESERMCPKVAKSNIVNCKTCGAEMAKNAKACPSCGAKNKKPIFMKWWFWLAVVMIVVVIALSGGNDTDTSNGNQASSQGKNSSTVNAVASVFDGDCGIAASAEIGNNIINYPELAITITNTTDKEIAAIQFYAVPYDVYGDEIKGWTTQSKLYTDTPISAGETTTVSYQLIEQSVKTVKLYVYSVYFTDGTEWGDKDATTSKILAGAPIIEVDVKS